MASSRSSSEPVAGRRPLAGARPALALVALAVLAVNLRTPTASLPPLVAHVQGALRLSGAASGLLTALPVLCMALCAPAAQRLAHRVGRETATLWAIGLVAAGALLRLGGSAAGLLYAGTVVAGIGIAVSGVTLPGIVKERFPHRPGAATAAYSVPMMLGAAVAPALAVPLARSLGSWQASLASWSLPALLAAALWAPLARGSRRPAGTADGRLPWRSRSAWLLAGFLSAQSMLAYAYLAWLAPAYESRGGLPRARGRCSACCTWRSSPPRWPCPRSPTARATAGRRCSAPCAARSLARACCSPRPPPRRGRRPSCSASGSAGASRSPLS